MGVMRWTLAAAVCGLVCVRPVLGGEPEDSQSVSQWSRELWKAAEQGESAHVRQLLGEHLTPGTPEAKSLEEAARRLEQHLENREAKRAEREKELRDDFTKALGEAKQNAAAEKALSKALKSATELSIIVEKKDAFLAEGSVKEVGTLAERAARAAEESGNLMAAGELFGLLNALHEETGQYKKDVERLNQRLAMLRLYVPERLWQLRDERQKAMGEKALPPYNPLGDGWKKKLEGVTQSMVERAVDYAEQHVEQPTRRELLRTGLEAVRNFVTTQDLRSAFPGLADAKPRAAMLAFLNEQIGAMDDAKAAQVRARTMLDRLRATNADTIKVPDEVLLHEFGNGVMQRLDEFSQIIWPDELRRFQRTTQGTFVGVGIQLEYDDLMNVRVVTPLQGTPAHKAGVRPKDVITKVDGHAIFGLSLDQAIDLITGPAGTKVVLTVERADADKPDAPKKEVDIPITRGVIEVYTARGWKRNGQRETDWDWYIDPDSRIGYVRLSQFTQTTGDELSQVIASLKQTGVNGLILDLRYNPGGLLDQAVRVARRFVNVPNGKIVGYSGPGNLMDSPEMSRPAQATAADIPLVVLVNEGSASASEIVTGALKCYAEQGALDALVVGQRSYGKGSVQNVWSLTSTAAIKVTIQYYTLPNDKIIHRRVGSPDWGVTPNLAVDMLPKQTEEAILLRRDADVIPPTERDAARSNPDDLLTRGLDPQLETAVLLLKARAAGLPEQAAKK